MALAQRLCLASGIAEVCLDLRKIILHASNAFLAKGVGAVSKWSSLRRGSVLWDLAPGAVLPLLRMVVANRFGL